MRRGIHNEVGQPIIGGSSLRRGIQQLSGPANNWGGRLLRRGVQQSIAPAEWDLLRRGVRINRAGRIGCIAARHSNQSHRPNGMYCDAAFESIAPAEWDVLRRGVRINRAGQMDRNGGGGAASMKALAE
jgi:hypothetical protein